MRTRYIDNHELYAEQAAELLNEQVLSGDIEEWNDADLEDMIGEVVEAEGDI